eukprot:c45743_g1_i1 orf=164-325(+)
MEEGRGCLRREDSDLIQKLNTRPSNAICLFKLLLFKMNRLSRDLMVLTSDFLV